MIDAADTPPRLALHACCGPCLIEPFDALAAEGIVETVVVYANPNIHPAEEYEHRLATLREYAEQAGIRVVELPYEPDSWHEATRGADTIEERCRACYRLRLGMVARWASEHGYDALTTTLTVSPYQNPDAINEAGEDAAFHAGIAWLTRDYRERYPDATRRSRDLGMYRQNYCGCGPSDAEAAVQREARRAERAARRR